ncbi:MAG: DUF2063 domain-containing protein [Deltaproteobacteria bacterium]|nr:MAG: DUF2063 domain-containing protein [Deltaproteobacteria bacterium]
MPRSPPSRWFTAKSSRRNPSSKVIPRRRNRRIRRSLPEGRRHLMPEAIRLARLEEWLLSEIRKPTLLPRVRRSADPPVHTVVRPSRTLSAGERVAIYARMYFARLHDALVEDYPTLYCLLGAEGFERLARRYLTAHPSRSYTLNDLGKGLPEFLSGKVRIPRRALLCDVARLERSISEVFDAEERPPLSSEDFRAFPPECWETARLTLIPAFRLHAFDHPVNALVTAARKGLPLPPCKRGRSWVAVYRKAYQVWRMDLSRCHYEILRSIAGGAPFGEAIAHALQEDRGDPAQLEKEIFRGFQEWSQEGFFCAVE